MEISSLLLGAFKQRPEYGLLKVITLATDKTTAGKITTTITTLCQRLLKMYIP